MEIKNKLTVTRVERGEVEGSSQGTFIKGPVDKDNGGGLNVGDGGVGQGRVMGEKGGKL